MLRSPAHTPHHLYKTYLLYFLSSLINDHLPLCVCLMFENDPCAYIEDEACEQSSLGQPPPSSNSYGISLKCLHSELGVCALRYILRYT